MYKRQGEGLTKEQVEIAKKGAKGALVTDAAAIAAAETGVAEVDAAQEILTEQDANRAKEKSNETKKFRDDQVVLKKETFTVTTEDGGRVEVTVKTNLDGSLSLASSVFFDAEGNQVDKRSTKLGDNDIIVRDGTTAEERVRFVFENDGDVVEKTSEISGTEVNNPKKIAQLTADQKQRLGIPTLKAAAKKRLNQDIGSVDTSPEQAIENKELMNKIVEGDISAAGTLVQKNAGLILPLLSFNPDITTQSGVTSEDVLQAVTDMMTPGIVDIVFTKEKTGEQRNKSLAEEYAKEKGEVSTFLGRLRFRKKEIYTAAGLDPNKFNLVDIDSSTKQIVDEGSDPKPKPEKEVATTQVDPREFGPVTEGTKLKDVEGIVKVTDKERLTFKKLASKYFDKVSQALFGMPGKKVRGNVSLKYADVKGQPSSSEASKLQNIFKNVEDVRSFIKAMPPYNVATGQTVIDRQGKKIDVSKDVRGRSVAINPTVLKKFYQPVTRAIEGLSLIHI